MLTYKITLPDSPHPVIIISKNLGFQALYVARQNEFWVFFSFNKYKIFFIVFGLCTWHSQWRSEWGRKGRIAPGGNQEWAAKIGVATTKNKVITQKCG